MAHHGPAAGFGRQPAPVVVSEIMDDTIPAAPRRPATAAATGRDTAPVLPAGLPPGLDPVAVGRAHRHVDAPPVASPAGPATVSAAALASHGLATNVVRVPFGVRRPRRQRPERAATWATLVIPFQLGNDGPPPTPPWAA